MKFTGAVELENCYYGSHSPRIGGFKKFIGLQFTFEWIMQRIDWSAEKTFLCRPIHATIKLDRENFMFYVYFYSQNTVTTDSDWIFGNMLTVPVSQ